MWQYAGTFAILIVYSGCLTAGGDETPGILFKHAKNLYADGQINQALTLFEKAADAQPSCYEVQLQAAEAFMLQSNYKKAIDYASRALNLNTNKHNAYIIRAYSHYHLNMHKQAYEDLSICIDGRPDDAGLYLMRGESRVNLNDNIGAICDFKTSYSKDANPLALFLVGQVYIDTMEFKKASDCFDMVINKHPKYPLGHIGKAITLYIDQNISAGDRHFDIAAKFDPNLINTIAEQREKAIALAKKYAK